MRCKALCINARLVRYPGNAIIEPREFNLSIHMTTKHRIFAMPFARVYPLLVAKAEKKGRKKAEVDAIICWLTGYSLRLLRIDGR